MFTSTLSYRKVDPKVEIHSSPFLKAGLCWDSGGEKDIRDLIFHMYLHSLISASFISILDHPESKNFGNISSLGKVAYWFILNSPLFTDPAKTRGGV